MGDQPKNPDFPEKRTSSCRKGGKNYIRMDTSDAGILVWIFANAGFGADFVLFGAGLGVGARSGAVFDGMESRAALLGFGDFRGLCRDFCGVRAFASFAKKKKSLTGTSVNSAGRRNAVFAREIAVFQAFG